MVDTKDLKSFAGFERGGSSPSASIMEKQMKYKFKLGDRIIADDGDIGLVLKVGKRPDTIYNQMGVLAYWKNEQLRFWMDINEPSIKIFKKESHSGNHKTN